MLDKALLAVDIGAGNIKMLYGRKKKVLAFQMVDIPKDSIDDNRITRIEAIYDCIYSFIAKNKLKPKFISFSIYGQDIIIRHIEVPYMKEANIKQTVEWEIGQNLPDAGINYYIDYEILNRDEGKRTKTYQIVVVAVLKARIEKYLELAKMLKLDIKAIDISANCTARAFKQLSIGKNSVKNVGIIDIGYNNTGITIVEKGKLSMERQVPFGIGKLISEIARINPELANKEFEYLQCEFKNNNMESELDLKISRLLDNVFSSFQKVIQFYTTGKIDKNISQLYVIGGGCVINGIEELVQSYLLSPTKVVKSASSVGLKIKLPRGCELQYFINALGLLLRED
jgi:type IV pilus assembly protein PilM